MIEELITLLDANSVDDFCFNTTKCRGVECNKCPFDTEDSLRQTIEEIKQLQRNYEYLLEQVRKEKKDEDNTGR